MTALLLSMLLACGDKEEEVADTAVEAEETIEPSTEDTSEEAEDTGSEEPTEEDPEESEFKTNDELGVCYPLQEVI